MNTDQIATVIKSAMQALLSLAIVTAYLYLVLTGKPAETLNVPVVGIFAFWFGQSIVSGYIGAKRIEQSVQLAKINHAPQEEVKHENG